MRYHHHFAEVDQGMLDWLTGLDAQQLAVVLANRLDTFEPPWPRGLDELALSLSEPLSVVLALRDLPAPGLQLVRAMDLCLALGDVAGVRPARLAEWLGTAPPEVIPVVESLAERGLAWFDSDGLVRIPQELPDEGYRYYRLGHPMAEILPTLTADDLKHLSSTLGLGSAGRKTEVLHRLLTYFRDPDRVANLLAGAPAGTRELLAECAWNGPDIEVDLGYGPRRPPATPATWCLARGLLWGTYEGTAHMPLEVGLALRGKDYHLDFDLTPPVAEPASVAAEQVAAEAAASALRLVDQVLTVVDRASAEPLPLLKNGRVGAQMITKLAKGIGASAEETRFAVELAIGASLLVATGLEQPARRRTSRRPAKQPPLPRLVASEQSASWRGEGTGTQLRSLVSAWWTLPRSPLADDKVVKSFLGDDPSNAFKQARQVTMRLVADAGGAIPADDLIQLVAWHTPIMVPQIRETLVVATLAEATALGVMACGAATDLAKAIVAGAHDPAFTKAVDQLVTSAQTTALFGTDLTAIVTGPPDSGLAALLDRAADREQRGVASGWRFSPASVRRALDNGVTAIGLIDELTSVAAGSLPQPLTYLINDVARRHGEVGVVDVGCVIVGDNLPLLTEITAHRKLAALGLRALAPTVLAATASSEATLAALRAAGYAPMPRAADGTIVIRRESPAAPKATARQRNTAEPELPRPDPREYAEQLLRAPRSTARRRHPDPFLTLEDLE